MTDDGTGRELRDLTGGGSIGDPDAGGPGSGPLRLASSFAVTAQIWAAVLCWRPAWDTVVLWMYAVGFLGTALIPLVVAARIRTDGRRHAAGTAGLVVVAAVVVGLVLAFGASRPLLALLLVVCALVAVTPAAWAVEGDGRPPGRRRREQRLQIVAVAVVLLAGLVGLAVR